MLALKTSGRSLVDSNGVVQPRMKGFNIQPVPWSQQSYNNIYSLGCRVVRTMVFWNEIQPTQGSVNMNYIATLDAHVQRVAAAGLYNILCFYYGPNNVHKPNWVGGSQLHYYTDNNNGQLATQFLANRYGNPSSSHYTPSVIGFGINEPTPDSSSNGYLAKHMTEQHTMMQWFRPAAPHWIGVISCGYGGGAPMHNAPGSGQNNQTFLDMAIDPFSGMGNWVMDVHCYKESTTTPTRVWDGRNAYGMPNNSDQIDVGSNPYPPSGSTRAQCQAFLTAFLASHVAYCAKANVPLIVGEWGWKPQYSGGANFATDFAGSMAKAGCVIEMQWDFNTSTSGDPWAGCPGGVWQSATKAWMGSALEEAETATKD